jgi:2-polyprenyl-6-methoxyphenol hydroxylase-like FAD-dependent oxidoreductase
LAELGLSVLVVDAGQDRARQLAGELLHPAGVEDLAALGYGDVISGLLRHEVLGFAVVDHRSGVTRETLLSYPRGDRGLSLEHSEIVGALVAALETKRGVTLWRRARVRQVPHHDEHGVELQVTREGGEEQVRARLLIVADGRSSSVRKMLGIEERHERLSTMLGVTVDDALLPRPRHGHLFIGGPAPVLAYTIAPGRARLMVDLPLGSTAARVKEDASILSGLPERLAAEVLASLDHETRMASNDTRIPVTTVLKSAALIGDAAGCCHPVSASGIASGVRDARELTAFVGARPHSIAEALQSYAKARRPAQRTRISLACALYRAFADRGPEMDALRTGLFRYWGETPDGADVSMSLLSSRESRIWVMAREYARVVAHGMRALPVEASRSPGRGMGWMARTGGGLLASAWPHLQSAAAGLMEDIV